MNAFRHELQRPVPIALAVLAGLGWMLLIGLWISYADDLADAEAALSDKQLQFLAVQSELTAQKQAAGDLANLRIQTDTVGSELSRATERQAAVEQKLSASTSRLEELENSIVTRSGQLDEMQAALKTAEDDLQKRKTELEEARSGVATQSQALTEIGQRVETAREEELRLRQSIAGLSEEATRLAKEAAGAEARVQEAREAEASTQEKLQDARLEFSRIAEQRTELQNQIEALSARREAVLIDVTAAENQRAALQKQVTELAANLEQRSKELADIEQRIEDQQSIDAGANGATTGDRIAPGRYQAGPMQAYFSSDGTFRMTSAGGDRHVTGRYSVTDDVLALDDAVGETGAATFPMRCRVQPQTNGFSLADMEGTCSALEGVTFEPSN